MVPANVFGGAAKPTLERTISRWEIGASLPDICLRSFLPLIIDIRHKLSTLLIGLGQLRGVNKSLK